MQLTLIIVFVITIAYMIKERSRVRGSSQESLSDAEKVLVWILCLLNPVVAGAIFNYGWKGKLPVKANQANKISWWAVLVVIVLALVVYFGGIQIPSIL